MAVRLGLLGASRIAPKAVVAPSRGEPRVKIAAVAASSLDRAETYAAAHDIPRALGGYQALVDDPEIDAVYCALPPSMHEELVIRALESGKHVLCEKPFAMNAVEARAMQRAADASGRVLMEAFHYFYHPAFQHVLGAVRSGRLGAISGIRGRFLARIADAPGQLRYNASLGGGALMDLGCYPLHMARRIAGAEPEVVSAQMTPTQGGVDLTLAARLMFPGVISAEIECSMAPPGDNIADLEIVGARGRLYLSQAVHPHSGHEISETIDGATERFSVDGPTTYDCQLRAFADAVIDGAPVPTDGADAVGNMAAIDAIYAKARA